MTLVIAKKNSNSIRIFSDTKKTDLTDVLKGISRSVLKSVILNRNLCVCFAGRIGYAYSSIQKLSGIIKQGYDDLDKAKDFLLKENQDSNNNVDFIIASLAPKFSLVKISDSKVEEVIDQCWIGNIDAFDDYQRRFHSTPGLDRGSLSRGSGGGAVEARATNPGQPHECRISDFAAGWVGALDLGSEFCHPG